MIQYNPFLKLNKLLIFTNEGKTAYNQSFHDGVNIIRGHNSSGKSTIANFIFYALGGDFNKWTAKAYNCKEVIVEIEINSAKITLKRSISEKGMQPMSMFWGNYEESKIAGSESWEIYPYKRSETKKSFSNALFVALGFPELRGDVDSNITMHQILRLIYVDQKSLTGDLMLTDNFDSSITRTTVANLMLGVYDDSLYADKLSLKEKEKSYEISKKQYEGIEKIFSSTGSETDFNVINATIEHNLSELKRIESIINKEEDEKYDLEIEIIQKNNIEILKQELLSEKRAYSDILEQIEYYEYEVLDSNEFILSLQKRNEAIDESLVTRELLGIVDINHCPHCLNVLKEVENVDDCKLCKQRLPEDTIKSHHKKMQQELDNQIRESKMLLKDKEATLQKLKSEAPSVINKIRSTQNEVDELLNHYKSKRNRDLDSLLEKKGELKSKNFFLIQQQKAVTQIDVLKRELKILNNDISNLRGSIFSKENIQKTKLQHAYSDIQAYSLDILKSDLGRQKEFSNAKKVELDFAKNTFSLDGQNNFSESSNVYLKNSIRFAIFFTSLKHDFFRFPRFILCDNIEDKGMQADRSKSFQRKIVELSQKSNINHQIIFTTSMVDDDLNMTDLCVGDFYNEDNKTLKNLG